MKIEDEIQQPHFTHEYLKAHVNLLYTAAWAGLQVNHFLKPYKISIQQFNILRILRGRQKEPASIKELTARMLDKASNASRIVDKLLEKNLVTKSQSDRDNRRVEILITPAGLELVNRASMTVEQEIIKMMSTLTIEEAALLNNLLDKSRG